MTALAFVAGWFVGAASLAFGLGALIRMADAQDRAAKTKPAGVRDPETGAVWTEQKRVDTWA